MEEAVEGLGDLERMPSAANPGVPALRAKYASGKGDALAGLKSTCVEVIDALDFQLENAQLQTDEKTTEALNLNRCTLAQVMKQV